MHVSFDSLKTFYNILIQKLKNHRGNWNQNDSTQPDYIKNRICYSEVLGETEVTIIEQETKQFEISDYGDVVVSEYYLTEDEKSILDEMNGRSGILRLTAGENTYEQSIESINDNLNVSFPVQLTGYVADFILTKYVIGTGTSLANMNIALTFITVDETVVKLPEKYIPDTVATKQYVDDVFNSIVNGDEVSY